MKFRYLLTVAGAAALAACGSEPEEAVVDTTTTATETVTPAVNADAVMPGSPQEFVTMTAASDMYEIEAANLAQENGTSQEVKDFAAMMIEDHNTSTENLKAAAAEAQPALTVEPALTPEHESNLEALRNAGENFDTVYAQQQVAAHEKTLNMLRSYAETGEVEPLQTFASNTADVVEGHLEQARELP